MRHVSHAFAVLTGPLSLSVADAVGAVLMVAVTACAGLSGSSEALAAARRGCFGTIINILFFVCLVVSVVSGPKQSLMLADLPCLR